MDKKTTEREKPRILAVASFGGHLVQLMRMMQPLERCNHISYISTAEEGRPSENVDYYVVCDFSRTNPWRALSQLKRMRAIMKQEKPDIVISTGAAPGLTAIVAAKMMGIRTLWIDSIANADRLSMCGRIARHIASKTLTQWPHLVAKNVEYHGNAL